MMLDRRLVVCVHDASPKHADRMRRIDEFLAEHGVGSNYSLLVVPDFWGEWPLQDDPEFCAWLRERHEAGVEMVLHGYYHLDQTRHGSRLTRLKSAALTADEGEFLGLSEDEARRRIEDGRKVVEDVLGARVEGFVAPAWLYSRGTRRALAELGFAFAEDQLSVWVPKTGRVVHRGMVVGYASRDRQRVASSLAWSRAATALYRSWPVVRQAIHPHDFDVRRLEVEIGRALDHFRSRRRLVSYAELAA